MGFPIKTYTTPLAVYVEEIQPRQCRERYKGGEEITEALCIL